MISKKIISDKKNSVALWESEITDPGKDYVQVRVVSSIVSPGTERAFIKELENTTPVWPLYIGYSAAGVVEKVGEGVKKFKPGDRVAGAIAHRSIANLPEGFLTKIPEGVDFDEAAYIHIGNITIQAVRKAKIELGEACVVFGAGLIGLAAAQFAKANGAYPVIQIDQVPSKLERALEGGADFVINSAEEGWKEKILEITDGKGAQVVIESTGFPQPIVDSLQIAARYGRVVILSSTRGNPEINFYRDVHKKGIVIIGAHISTCPERESYPSYWTEKDNAKAVLNLLAADRIRFTHVASEKKHYSLYGEIYNRVLDSDRDYVTTIIDWRD